MNSMTAKRNPTQNTQVVFRHTLIAVHFLSLVACDLSSSDTEAVVTNIDSPVAALDIEGTSAPEITIPSQTPVPTVGSSPVSSEVNGVQASNGAQAGVAENSFRAVTVDDLINAGSEISPTFWVCTSEGGARSFRYRFGTIKRLGIPDNMNEVRVVEDTVGGKIEIGRGSQISGPSFQGWQKLSPQEIRIVPDLEEFSSQNYTWTLLQMNALLTRAKVQDSRGFDLSCARIIEATGSPPCRYDFFETCSLTNAGVQTEPPILVDWGVTKTDRFINGGLQFATNYWACERGNGLEPFRMNVGNLNLNGIGDVRILEGSTGDENSLDLDWKADSVMNIQFLSSFTQDEVIVWTLFGFDFSSDGLKFTASDARGFDFSCERKNESPDYFPSRPDTSCFVMPERCNDGV